ncbi:MAG: hypothetical protein QOD58_1897 [Mycobacterium sp.]|nr:hypothetical protein [Mycobacterium sp.]
MGVSGGDAGCRARNYVKWHNGILYLPAAKHSDSRTTVLGGSLTTASFEEKGRHDDSAPPSDHETIGQRCYRSRLLHRGSSTCRRRPELDRHRPEPVRRPQLWLPRDSSTRQPSSEARNRAGNPGGSVCWVARPTAADPAQSTAVTSRLPFDLPAALAPYHPLRPDVASLRRL